LRTKQGRKRNPRKRGLADKDPPVGKKALQGKKIQEKKNAQDSMKTERWRQKQERRQESKKPAKKSALNKRTKPAEGPNLSLSKAPRARRGTKKESIKEENKREGGVTIGPSCPGARHATKIKNYKKRPGVPSGSLKRKGQQQKGKEKKGPQKYRGAQALK